MIENVFFLCDQKQCPDCSYPECKHTIRLDYSKTYRAHPSRMLIDVHNPDKFASFVRDETITDYWEKEDQK